MSFFTLIINGLEGQTTTIGPVEKLGKQSTVAQLKEVVKKLLKVKVEEQRLVFASKEMNDNFTLADYNIEDNSSIFLVLGLRGGKFRKSKNVVF